MLLQCLSFTMVIVMISQLDVVFGKKCNDICGRDTSLSEEENLLKKTLYQ